MGNLKISQLPSASTSSGDDLYPIVQSGSNYSITFALLQDALAAATLPAQLPTITLTGSIVGSGSGGSIPTTITNGSVINLSLADMPAFTIKGNVTGSSASPSDLTSSEVTSILNLFTPSLQGLVPPSGGGTTNFLRADGIWAPGGGGGGGIATSIVNTFSAGQSFPANTSYIVRWGMNSLSETADMVYAADYNTSSYDEFWAIGIASSPSSVSIGEPIEVCTLGMYTLASSDTPFNTSDIGNPIWLTTGGAFSTTPPAVDNEADFKLGIVINTSTIWVDYQMMGVGGSNGGGGGGGGTPGGANNSIQFNDAGTFGGFGTWDGTTLTDPGNFIAIGNISAANLSGTNTGNITLGTPNGLSLSAQVVSLGTASASTTGALDSTDWNTFNSKMNNVLTQNVYVAIQGNDTTGDGSIGNPFASINHALSTITLNGSNQNGSSARYAVIVSAGAYNETQILLKPYVTIVGDAMEGTYIRVNGGAGSVTLDPSWGSSETTGRSGIFNCYFGHGTGMDLDFYSMGPNTGTPSAVIYLAGITVTGTTYIAGRMPGIDYLEMYDCLFASGVTLNDISVGPGQGLNFESTLVLNGIYNTDSNFGLQFVNSVFSGAITIGNTSPQLFQVQIASSNLASTLSISGTGTQLTLDSVSTPIASNITLTSPATITYTSFANGVAYTPADASKWVAPAPTTVQQALDRLAAVVGSSTPIP
jgi:hypothetical protein